MAPLRLLSSDKVLGAAYEVLVPKDPPLAYYVAMLVDKRVKWGEVETVPFPKSQMGRQLLLVKVDVPASAGPAGPLLLATAHLESTKDHAVERKRQLLQALRLLRKRVPPKGAALLAGDLNIRDEERGEAQALYLSNGDVIGNTKS